MKKNISAAIRKIPPLNTLLEQRGLRSKFADEIALEQNKSQAQTAAQSILFFTAHKCASVYVGEILRGLTQSAGMVPINLESYYSEALGKTASTLSKQEQQVFQAMFKPSGYFYGPIREIEWPLPSLSPYKILLVLRDPRDVLTSLYFSVAYSHTVVNNALGKNLLKDREEAQAESIDTWVIEHAETFLKRYQFYSEHLLPDPAVCFLKYEHMVLDFPDWFEQVNHFLALKNISSELQSKILSEANFQVEESVTAHKRQVQPGDHKRKLKPSTIAQLNKLFSDVLQAFNYPVEA